MWLLKPDYRCNEPATWQAPVVDDKGQDKMWTLCDVHKPLAIAFLTKMTKGTIFEEYADKNWTRLVPPNEKLTDPAAKKL